MAAIPMFRPCAAVSRRHAGILDIIDDRILAIRGDDLDVPAVVIFELIKP